MPLIDEVKQVCRGLARAGWRELFQAFGLDIGAADLATELRHPLDRLRAGRRPSIPGFEDLDPLARQGVEPGLPERSLLYHALASPMVVRRPRGGPLGAFPTPKALQAVENYVFGAEPPSLDEVRQQADGLVRGAGRKLAIVVFATEYRPGREAVHPSAETCFSRTGVARVGTVGARYVPASRGFGAAPPGRPHDFCVLPARYAAYLAFPCRGPRPSVFGPLAAQTQDRGRTFWVPLHKLFSGRECLRGLDLRVALSAHHVNDKLERVYRHEKMRGVRNNIAGLDRSRPPFRFEDGIAELASARAFGEGLLLPVPHRRLVEPARVSGRVLAFRVPRSGNNLSSSLRLDEERGDVRLAPEYVHARHEWHARQPDLNRLDDVVTKVSAGGYFAVHYLDFTGDGWIEASCPQLASLPTHAAYSLVTAPDFYFSTSQRELMDWSRDDEGKIPPAIPNALKNPIWNAEPYTLSDERYPPNLALTGSRFAAGDRTITAIVALPLRRARPVGAPAGRTPDRHSCLPDAASGVFEPGWDVSLSRSTVAGKGVKHLATFGLGSPFPEDAKLCAALSSFWPGVAPDAARTFEPFNEDDAYWPTIAPMTDREIGVDGGLSWDGYRGPRLLPGGGEVEYTSFAHADYVTQALEGRFSLALTSKVGSQEYRERVAAMARVYRSLGIKSRGDARTKAKARWAVLSFREAGRAERERREAEGSLRLSGRVFRFQVYQHGKKGPVRAGRVRVQVKPGTMTVLYVSDSRILMKQASGRWKRLRG